MVQSLSAELKGPLAEGLRCGQVIYGVPFSIALWAARNAHAHQNEWYRRIKLPITVESRKKHETAFRSIDPLLALVPPRYDAGPEWGATSISLIDVLLKFSDGNYRTLYERVISTCTSVVGNDPLRQAFWERGIAWGNEAAN